MTSGFVPIWIIGVIAGLIFASIALRTAKEASAALASAGDPTKIEVNKYITISTGNAVVALFILAVIFGCGVPATLLFLDSRQNDAPITFETQLDPVPTTLTINAKDYGPALIPQFRLYRSSTPQHFSISAPEYDPVEVEASYDWSNQRFDVIVDGRKDHADVKGTRASLADVVKLRRAQVAAKKVEMNLVLHAAKGITLSERQFPDPPEQIRI